MTILDTAQREITIKYDYKLFCKFVEDLSQYVSLLI